MKRIACGMGVAAMVSVVACGGSAASSAAAPSASRQAAADMCAKACAVREKCSGSSDGGASCRSACAANPGLRHVDALRPEVVEAVGTCIGSLTCDEVASDARDAVKPRCLLEAKRGVAATPKAATACARFDALTNRCGGKMPAHCTDTFKLVNDELLDQFVACTSDDNSCKSAGRCIREVSASFVD